MPAYHVVLQNGIYDIYFLLPPCVTGLCCVVLQVQMSGRGIFSALSHVGACEDGKRRDNQQGWTR